MDEHKEPDSSGWDAIDKALRNIYGDVEPKHWGTVIPYFLGGNDPLTGLSAYQDLEDGKSWHFVTYGFSELYEKEFEDPEVSGFGFELTFRLATDDVEANAPWVFSFLQNLARYVFKTGRTFGQGHTIPLNGPICQGSVTKIVAVAFAQDSQLGEIVTPNGSVEFLQIVGLTEEELIAIQSWNARSFFDLMATRNPKLVTDINRESYLNDPVFAEQVAIRSAEEGATCGEIYSDCFTFKKSRWTRKCTVSLGAYMVEDLTNRLQSRLTHGRDLAMISNLGAIAFVASDKNSWTIDKEVLTIELTGDATQALCKTLQPVAGEYQVPGLDGMLFEVERSEIRDKDGKVVKVIG